MINKYTYIYILLIAALMIGACSVKDDYYPDPYEGGLPQIGINFSNTPPSPATGSAGQEMTFKVNGIMDFRDKLTFLANGTEAEIVNTTDSSITIILPENVSSGGSQIKIENQVFPGPSFKVRGKLNLDPTFTPGIGANGQINQILELANGDFILAGSFNSYQGRGLAAQVSSLVQINPSGNYTSALKPGSGPEGIITTLVRLPTGEYIAGGYFSSFNEIEGMNNIARLNANASIKTSVVDLYVSGGVSDPSLSKDTVSAFNGGVIGGVARLFAYNDQITAVGSFGMYGQYFYERSTKDRKLFDGVNIQQLVRMDLNGNLDSSYNFDKNTKEGLHGANGVISDAFMQADGKLILVGRFTRYNNTPVNNIVRLNIDGSIDETFVVGSAANDNIYTIRYNVNTKRYILTGSFNTFNGNPANKMVLLNEDGSVDQSFITGAFIEGVPTFAGQLNNGLILVAGSFSSYNNIIREGLMVLNPDGTLAVGYNNTGRFTGIVSDMVETTSGIGNLPSVILTGFIPRFEGNEVGNLLKLVFSK